MKQATEIFERTTTIRITTLTNQIYFFSLDECEYIYIQTIQKHH